MKLHKKNDQMDRCVGTKTEAFAPRHTKLLVNYALDHYLCKHETQFEVSLNLHSKILRILFDLKSRKKKKEKAKGVQRGRYCKKKDAIKVIIPSSISSSSNNNKKQWLKLNIFKYKFSQLTCMICSISLCKSHSPICISI